MVKANAMPWQALAASLVRGRLDEQVADNRLRHVERLLREAPQTGAFPCAVLAVAHQGKLGLVASVGEYRLDRTSHRPVATECIFDLASLTKVVATWLLAGWLEHRGILDLDMTVHDVFPAIPSPYSRQVTLGMLMTHTAGLARETRLDKYRAASRMEIVRGILRQQPEHPIGRQVIYTNRHFILLGEVVAAVAGLPLEEAAGDLWQRCGMLDTCFNPPASVLDRIVATEIAPSGTEYLRGIAHDENARVLGGAAGHAGAFSTAKDLLILASIVLSGGVTWTGERLLGTSYLARSLRDATPGLDAARGLAWGLGTSHGLDDSVALHHGFTGTSLLISPQKQAGDRLSDECGATQPG